MILDRLENLERYFPLNAGFAAACDYLRRTDFTKMSPGKHEIDGERLYVMLNKGPGRGRDAVKLEAHQRYIDIQYTIEGPDEIGWRPLKACRQVDTPFDAQKDFGLYADRPEAWVAVPPGSFAIFFPDDAHAPMGAGTGCELLKAVMKVAVDWR
ncbi:MAG: YhcH/YjgK/YiaL family protein [Planctomycetia bacterium]|nr:YhcH/YjgK/YiaL family protein [Planctomycetia bacterium]